VSDPFHTTVWTRILEAQRGQPDAVGAFVEGYRAPLLRWMRGQGFTEADAEDLVQELFLRLLSKDVLGRADRSRGRFRGFLLGVAKNVAREERERRGAKKRGGGARPVPLDEAPEPAVEADPEFDRLWSDHLLERALQALKQEAPRLHEALSLRFQQEKSHKEIAEAMGRNIQQVKNDLHRARLKLVERIKADIAAYASTREEYEEEVAALLAFLGETG
jgi:RNA polymerase sigma factor (sigma-70 family)